MKEYYPQDATMTTRDTSPMELYQHSFQPPPTSEETHFKDDMHVSFQTHPNSDASQNISVQHNDALKLPNHPQGIGKRNKTDLLKCKMCQQVFSTPGNLRRHSNLCGVPRNQRSVIHCPVCYIPFTRKDNLKDHMQTKHQNVKYKCVFCHEQFDRKALYRVHKRICSNRIGLV